MAMNALAAHNVDFTYAREEVIKNISLTLKQGAFLGIIGPNGAGKSTLLRLLCGILQPQQGSVELFGVPLHTLKPRQRAQQIAFVPQETHFSLDFTVEDVVSTGRYPYLSAFQKEGKKDTDAINYALDYAHVHTFRKRSINTLSSGERQRVVIARTLAQEPAVMLLDEPTSHLDLHHQHAIMELLTDLHQRGISIIIVNHDLNIASLYCHHLLLVHRGSVYREGAPRAILSEHILKEVYGVRVKVIDHPDRSAPQILLQPKGDKP